MAAVIKSNFFPVAFSSKGELYCTLLVRGWVGCILYKLWREGGGGDLE